MSENVQITPGSGVTIGADSVTDGTLGSAQIQYIKIMDGTIGGTNKATVTSNGLAIDGSAVTQPISAISLPLPTGASTESTLALVLADTDNLDVLLSTRATEVTLSGVKTQTDKLTFVASRLLIDGSGVTQPVSGTITANAGTGNFTVIQSVGTSLHTNVDNFPASQTVNGTVAVTQSTSPWVISGTVTTTPPANASTNLTEIGGSAVSLGQKVSAISIPVVIASDQSAIAVTGTITTSPNVNVHDGSGNTIASTGTSLNVDVTNTVPVTGTFFQATQPVSGTVAATQSGSWTVSLTSESIEIGTVDQGTPNTLANAWPIEITDGINVLGTNTNPLRIDPTGTTTQPVSLTSTTITGTVDVTQSTSPWVISGSVSVSNASIAVTQSGVWSVGRTWTLASGTDSVSVVQSGTWNINNISGTISLPTGASTSAKQPALGTAGSASTDVITVQGIAGMTALKVDGSGVTQPVSGTVTANQGTSPWVVSLASTTITGTVTVAGNLTHNNAAPIADNIGVLPAIASVASPTYTAGDQVLLSTDLSGNLRVTIDGTVTEQNVNLNQVGGSAISIGQATMAASLPVVIASNQSSIPVTLTSTTITGTVAVTQSTSPWVISGTVTSNIGTTNGLALDATVSGLQVAQGSTTSGQKGDLILGAVTTASPSYTTAQTNPLSLTLAGALRVDGSATTQPVSGTITANAGTGNFNVVGTTTDGTTTETSFLVIGGETNDVTAQYTPIPLTAGGASVKVDGSAVTQPVSGTVTANQGGAPWTQNLTEVGGVAVTAVTSKSTQPSSFIGMQAPKDSGRTYVTFTADAVAGVTSETLVTFTLNKQGTTTATQTNYTPTSGKTLRIQSITLSVQSGAGAGGWVRVKLRHNTAGATTTSSALVCIGETGTTNATALGAGLSIPIPDGLEIFGDGTQTIGITHLSSAVTTVESITLVGYEY